VANSVDPPWTDWVPYNSGGGCTQGHAMPAAAHPAGNGQCTDTPGTCSNHPSLTSTGWIMGMSTGHLSATNFNLLILNATNSHTIIIIIIKNVKIRVTLS